MPTMKSFNHDFDEEYMDVVIQSLQECVGCFGCKKDGPTLRCSRCKVSKYCSKDCQKVDWKEEHKKTCEAFTCTKAMIGSVPFALRRCHYISEEVMSATMDERVRLFFAEFKRWGEENDSLPPIHLQVSAIWNVGRVRLLCAVTFWDEGQAEEDDQRRAERGETRRNGPGRGRACVNGLMLHSVDEGEEARVNLDPPYGGSGSISSEARTRVLDKLTWFIQKANGAGIEVAGLTYGRGLMWMSDDEFRDSDTFKKWKRLKVLMMIPDSIHAMQDSMIAGRGAASGEGNEECTIS